MDVNISKDDPAILMCLAKEGDSDAFGKLYLEYFTPVFRYVYYMIKDKETASDITQTVFLKVFQSLQGYQERGKSPLAYFFTVARTTVIDHWKKKKDISVDFTEEGFVESVSVASSLDEIHGELDKAKVARVATEAMQSLPDDQREILTLKFIQDFSNKEISELIGKSEANVRQIQSRALNRLRRVLKEKISNDKHSR